jgi:hypothetical protein
MSGVQQTSHEHAGGILQPNDSISVIKRLQIAGMMLAPITSSGSLFVLL